MSAITTSVSTAEMMIEPRQPRRLEKKKNMPDKRLRDRKVSLKRHSGR